MPGELFDKLNELSGKRVEILGEEFLVSVEGSIEDPILTFSGDEKYGLRYSAFGRILSDIDFWDGDSFEKVKLRYFPVAVVKKVGASWDDAGDKDIYSLYEKDFNEIFKRSVVAKFLEKKC